MGRFVRLLTVLATLAAVAASVASPAAARREARSGPRSRTAARAVVHGRATTTSLDRPTSFDLFGSRAAAKTSAPRSSASPSPSAPAAVAGFDALTDPAATPSDTTGALGDTYIVAAVNTQVAVFDRTGTQLIASIPLDQLHPDTAGHFAFDPKVVYDQYNDEFVVVYLAQEDSPRFTKIVAVAIPNATAATTSTWCATSFAGDQIPGKPVVWADYPAVGYDLDRVTIETNAFTFPTSTGSFKYAQIMTIDKASLYDCTAPRPVPVVFGGTATLDALGLPAFTIQPAQTVDLPGTSQLLVASQIFGKGSYLSIWRITQALQLKKSFLPIGRTFPPPFGTQGGGVLTDVDTYWDTGDGRLINAFYDADANQLFAAHPVLKDFLPDPVTGGYPEAAVRWYEITPGTKLKSSSIARRGAIGAAEVDAGWPTVATDGSGNLFVTYSRASAVTNEFLSAWVAEIPPGSTTATQLLLHAGTGTYNFFSADGPERWGDFTAINRDPMDPAVVATFNQYAVDVDTWQQFVSLVHHV